MFNLERVYGERNRITGLIEWFFTAREGIFGPFANKDAATHALEEFKKFNAENGSDGGRDLNKHSKLTLLPLDSYLYRANLR